MATKTLYIGLDPGFISTKAAFICFNQIFTFILPSTVGQGRGKKGELTLNGIIRAKHSNNIKPFLVQFDNYFFYVGFNVRDFTEPQERLDFDRFCASPELLATIYAVLSQIIDINDPPDEIVLVIALPVQILQNETEAIQLDRDLKVSLIKKHNFSVDGQPYALSVANVRAKVPQPVASWCDWGMDMTGTWIRGKQSQMAPALIVDEGFNTLDVVLIEDGRINQRFSVGDTLGMRRAAERLIRTIEDKYGTILELRRADELIQHLSNNQPAQIYVNGFLTDVTREAKQCLGGLASDVHNFLDQTIGRKKTEYNILLTGGGALALLKRLMRQFPNATVIADPVAANARGLAKLCQRSGFFK